MNPLRHTIDMTGKGQFGSADLVVVPFRSGLAS
jgi:hypothetical protein